jgi:hypothetical protein
VNRSALELTPRHKLLIAILPLTHRPPASPLTLAFVRPDRPATEVPVWAHATGASTEVSSRLQSIGGTALGSQRCGCRRPRPLGRRTTRQNDGRRHPDLNAYRHVWRVLDPFEGGQRRSRATSTSRPPLVLTGDVFVDPGPRTPPLAVWSLLRPEAAPLNGSAKHKHALGLRDQRHDGNQTVGPSHSGDDEAVEVVGDGPGDELPEGPRIAVVGAR